MSLNTCAPVLYLTTPLSDTKNLSVSVVAFAILVIDKLAVPPSSCITVKVFAAVARIPVKLP